MAASVLVDAGFLIALLSRRDTHHRWAVTQAQRLPPPWKTCEAALSEAFHLLGGGHEAPLCELLRRKALVVGFDLGDDLESVLKLIAKLQVWNALPNGRKATFFNLWAGHRFRRAQFRARLREDLAQVFALVRDGVVEPQIAARYPLTEAADALRFAEAGGFTGKVVLVPGG